jgi:XisH protein
MAKDMFHQAVKNALVKEQWTITADPLRFQYGDVNFQVDLEAERLFSADRGNEKIAVEIKSFLNPSAVTDFYGALGQFLSYRLALETIDPDRLLYLAIPADAYKTFFQLAFTQEAIRKYQILLFVCEPINEVILQWIN